MSWVANMLVSVHALDVWVVEELSSWLENDAPYRDEPEIRGVGSLRSLTGQSCLWGGWKNPECNVWGGALNHADLDAVIRHIETMPWMYPAVVQVLLEDQEQSYFRLYMFRDGRLGQYAPPPPPNADELHAW